MNTIVSTGQQAPFGSRSSGGPNVNVENFEAEKIKDAVHYKNLMQTM